MSQQLEGKTKLSSFEIQALKDNSLLALLLDEKDGVLINANKGKLKLSDREVEMSNEELRHLLIDDIISRERLETLIGKEAIEELVKEREITSSWRGGYFISTTSLWSDPSLDKGGVMLKSIEGQTVRFSPYGDQDDTIFRLIQMSQSGVTIEELQEYFGYTYQHARKVLESSYDKYENLMNTTTANGTKIYYSKIRPEWKQASRNWGDNLHSVCSYLAMFPASMPHYFIKKLTDEGDVVLDPFSGRGTTLFEAIKNDRIGIGNDLNPLARVLTKSKVNPPAKEQVLERLRELEEGCEPKRILTSQVEDKVDMLFHEYTLSQLLYLKEELGDDRIDNFIKSSILGILHGNTEGYLSISMPNTYSMSPNYVSNYIDEHGLEKHKRDVFEKARDKLDRIYEGREEIEVSEGFVTNTDARNISEEVQGNVDLIFTSPPYLRLVNYGDQNWIRLWFLDEDSDDVDDNLFTTQSKSKYLNFMRDVMEEFYETLSEDGVAVIVIGDVNKKRRLVTRARQEDEIKMQPRVKERILLGEELWIECAEDIGFEKVALLEDSIDDAKKSTKIWGEDRGEATDVDRLLVLSKDKDIDIAEEVDLDYSDSKMIRQQTLDSEDNKGE
jgi:site-specific DNA-methyltransferase (adenine-specific)